MGFLKGLVNDMLKESTGYDVRKITRMVGGKNLLMMGAGAALAGGMAGGFGQGPNDGPSSWAEPPRGGGAPPPGPPMPPAPGVSHAPPTPDPLPATSASLPSLPPVPAAAEPAPLPPSTPIASPPAPSTPKASTAPIAPEPVADDDVPISEQLTYAIVRAMVSAALADGHLDEKEKTTILDRLDSSGLSAERVQQVHRDLVIPPTPSELASLTDSFDEREAMYRFAGLIILSDGQVSGLERSWLDRLAVAFGFDADRKNALEAEIFAR